MAACTFFGHRDCPDTIKPHLREVLVELIVSKGVDTFYVGSQGRFDGIVRSALRELESGYPQIHYTVVLAYMPGKKQECEDFSDTILPEGIETAHPRYAIDWRNRWMLLRSDYVVTYITRTWGGAVCGKSKAVREDSHLCFFRRGSENDFNEKWWRFGRITTMMDLGKQEGNYSVSMPFSFLE